MRESHHDLQLKLLVVRRMAITRIWLQRCLLIAATMSGTSSADEQNTMNKILIQMKKYVSILFNSSCHLQCSLNFNFIAFYNAGSFTTINFFYTCEYIHYFIYILKTSPFPSIKGESTAKYIVISNCRCIMHALV